ncbi:MAG: RidA family protein [Longimicrobiales bacterium]
MTQRRRVPAATRWADVVSYSRAIRVGDTVHVSGTTSVDDAGGVIHQGDARAQTFRALEIIEHALQELGAVRSDVVRTRMFVVDLEYWEDVGRAHGEFFRGIDPATSMVFARLIDDDLLVEIEAEAVITR